MKILSRESQSGLEIIYLISINGGAMSEVAEMSTCDLYMSVRYINDRLTSDDRMQSLSWARVQALQAYKQELLEEINRRDNERFR